MNRIALVLAVVLGISAVTSVSVADEPKVSNALAKPLKAANDAMQAKKYDEVLTKTREAAALSPKTAYDEYVIHYMQMVAYSAKGDNAQTMATAESIVASPYLQASAKPQILRTLMGLNYQEKNYDNAIKYGEQAIAAGDTNPDTKQFISQAYFLSGKCKDALTSMQALIARDEQAGRKPSENNLKLIWQCAIKVKDDGAASRAVEKLILHYPKPDYWLTAMNPFLSGASGNDDRLKLLTYRLESQVGILKRGADYRDMALIALDQGNPGEAQSILKQAFDKNLYTDKHEIESNKRLLDTATKRAGDDRASMAKEEKLANAATTGDPLVQIGAAYLGFGEADKALASINAGIAKGNLKHPDEAYILLGIVQNRAKNSAEAVKAFNKATVNPKYAQLAKLWALEARS